MAETDPHRLADELEQQAGDMERASERLERETKAVAQDWERKRADDNVPGAPPPSKEEPDEPPTGAPSGKGGDKDQGDEDQGDEDQGDEGS